MPNRAPSSFQPNRAPSSPPPQQSRSPSSLQPVTKRTAGHLPAPRVDALFPFPSSSTAEAFPMPAAPVNASLSPLSSASPASTQPLNCCAPATGLCRFRRPPSLIPVRPQIITATGLILPEPLLQCRAPLPPLSPATPEDLRPFPIFGVPPLEELRSVSFPRTASPPIPCKSTLSTPCCRSLRHHCQILCLLPCAAFHSSSTCSQSRRNLLPAIPAVAAPSSTDGQPLSSVDRLPAAVESSHCRA